MRKSPNDFIHKSSNEIMRKSSNEEEDARVRSDISSRNHSLDSRRVSFVDDQSNEVGIVHAGDNHTESVVDSSVLLRAASGSGHSVDLDISNTVPCHLSILSNNLKDRYISPGVLETTFDQNTSFASYCDLDLAAELTADSSLPSCTLDKTPRCNSEEVSCDCNTAVPVNDGFDYINHSGIVIANNSYLDDKGLYNMKHLVSQEESELNNSNVSVNVIPGTPMTSYAMQTSEARINMSASPVSESIKLLPTSEDPILSNKSPDLTERKEKNLLFKFTKY